MTAQDAIQISSEAKLSYFTQIPNVIYEMGLKSNVIAVYTAILRTAGNAHGYCCKSLKRLANEAGVSERSLREIKEKLCEVQPVINKPLIRVEKRKKANKEYDTDLITIVDIMPENVSYFYNKSKERVVPKTTVPPNLPTAEIDTTLVPKTPGKEYPVKEKHVLLCANSSAVADSSHLKDLERVNISTYNQDIELSKSQLISRFILRKFQCSLAEIDEIFEVLKSYNGKIRDIDKFCEGTILNRRGIAAIKKLKDIKPQNSKNIASEEKAKPLQQEKESDQLPKIIKGKAKNLGEMVCRDFNIKFAEKAAKTAKWDCSIDEIACEFTCNITGNKICLLTKNEEFKEKLASLWNDAKEQKNKEIK